MKERGHIGGKGMRIKKNKQQKYVFRLSIFKYHLFFKTKKNENTIFSVFKYIKKSFWNS